MKFTKSPSPELDLMEVQNPSHYMLRKDLEVRDVINAFLNKIINETPYPSADPVFAHLYEYSNAVKYLLRSPFKADPVKDLKKAKFCIESILKTLEEYSGDGGATN